MVESTPQDNQPPIDHRMVMVHLAMSRFFPGHINPDFLRFNGIVDPDWQLDLPVIIESRFAQVDYRNGLSVTAGEDNFRVAQAGQPLDLEEIAVPDVMARYLEVAPLVVECKAIITEWRGTIRIGNEGGGRAFSPLYGLAQRANTGGVTPEAQLRLTYDFPDKNIALFISEAMSDDTGTEVQLGGLAFRNMENLPADEQDEFINSTLESLNEDIDGFVELATQFYFG